MTYKLIGGDQKEYGPVSADQLRQWIADGRANAQTMVLAEGASQWKPLAGYPEFAEALAAQTSRVAPATGPSPPVNQAMWTTEILARHPTVRIGSCLARAWALLRADFGLLFGASAVVWVISLLQFVPLVSLLYLIFSGVFYGGLYRIVLKRIRGEPASISQVFDGFSTNFIQLLLAGAISSVLSAIGIFCCCLLPGIYLLVAWTFGVPLVADKRFEFWSSLELSRKVVTRVWFQMFALRLLAFLPFLIVTCFVLAKAGGIVFITLERVVSSGQMDLERIVQAFAPLTAGNFVLDALTSLVLLLNLPFAVVALMVAYEDIFGPRPTPTT